MKLRLLREDGTPARLDDLAAFAAVEIDGIECTIVEYEGPDPKDGNGDTTEDSASICLRMDYQHQRRDRYVRRGPGRTETIASFQCPFARRARVRAAGGES